MGLERFAGGANGRKGLLSAGELGLGGGGWQSFGNDMGGGAPVYARKAWRTEPGV